MKTQIETPTFRIHAAASAFRVAARLAVLATLAILLAAGFVLGVEQPTHAATEQVAASPATCGTAAC